ncbi:3-deoxy-manno-octulosonate cytidylyltransferase [Tepidamorphus sp. 3E244]|uniref:3-deoxy-manno-octulosonate cytidylyltransferase n=1 Tax=Tepidamorphus sp. 3E244 TaxID=3385498 RepID=UPI0038FC4B88
MAEPPTRGHPLNALVIIPARMASTRLPGKPLADIAGAPMIVHVARRALEADIGPVAVATDSDEIADAVAQAGMTAVMTAADHPSGSDRVREAADTLDPDRAHDLIVNLQGDLPAIDPAAIRAAAEAATTSGADIATLAVEIEDDAERIDPNVVKAVVSDVAAGPMRALYFTRATTPAGDGPLWHHVGIYAWRRSALDRFVSLPPSPLELRERLEQLRALEHGMSIAVAPVSAVPLGVDTPGDLERVRAMFAARLAQAPSV